MCPVRLYFGEIPWEFTRGLSDFMASYCDSDCVSLLYHQPPSTTSPKPSGSKRLKSGDYKAWDEYDAEREAAKTEESSSSVPKEGGTRSTLVSPGLTDRERALPFRERERMALREKEKGNEVHFTSLSSLSLSIYPLPPSLPPSPPSLSLPPLPPSHPSSLPPSLSTPFPQAFRASDYQEALSYYTRSILLSPSAPAYNNRAHTCMHSRMSTRMQKLIPLRNRVHGMLLRCVLFPSLPQ